MEDRKNRMPTLGAVDGRIVAVRIAANGITGRVDASEVCNSRH